ncbi:TolC family protein [bacterium]|nr:TolC family protein [bacterium]
MKKFLIIFLIFFSGMAVQANEYINWDFWKNFNDETLIENINMVNKNNNDLKAAAHKVNEAQRLVKISFANELPHIGFNGYVGQIFKSSDEVFGDITIPDYTETRFLLPLTMNYEIDIWGKNRLKTKSQKKRFEMMKQDEKSAYIYIISAFACDYYNLIKADKLIEHQKELIKTQEQINNFIKKRYDIGTATLSDVVLSEKTLTYMEEDLHNLLEKRNVLQNQMSTILSDRSFSEIKRTTYDEINVNIVIPETINSEILAQRPDIIKSQLDLERVGIDVKVAKRELLPSFVINGNLGFNMYSIASSHKFLANLGVAPTWDLFTGGRKIHTLKLQKEEYEIAVQRYEKSILRSIQETNDVLYTLKSNHKKYFITQNRLNADVKEFGYTQIRENIGTADSLDLLLKKEQLLISQKQETSLKINDIIAIINLYQALGGINFIEKTENI